MARDSQTCCIEGCQRQATKLCYKVFDKGQIKSPYVCPDHFVTLNCNYTDADWSRHEQEKGK